MVKRLRILQSAVLDVTYALRSLRSTPTFTATALATIALAIGGSTAIFTVVDNVLLRPLPFADAERLVRLYEVNPSAGLDRSPLSLPDLEDWQTETGAFAAAAGFQVTPQVLIGAQDPLEVQSANVTGAFFRTLGAPMALGRGLDDVDEREANRNVVISHGLWRSHFGGAASVVGSTISLRGEPFTVVGVAKPDFRFPAPDVALWIPQSVLTDRAMGPRTRGNRGFEIVARLAPGVSLERAAAAANVVAARLAVEHADTNAEWSAAAVVPLRTTLVGHVERALVLVLVAVGFILLIACANVTHLLLARGAARAREVATRMALGADRVRIARQAVTESCALAFAGGALGLGLAFVAVRVVVALNAGVLPRVGEIGIDLRVVGFAFAVSLAAGVLSGTLPAWRLAQSDPQPHLRSARVVAGPGRTRAALVAAEAALALVLVVGAGLMARSFLNLRSVDPGFEAEHALAVTLQMNLIGVPEESVPAYLLERRRAIVERVAALPGVTHAAMTSRLPLRDSAWTFQFRRVDGGLAVGETLRADMRNVSPDYFLAMGIPLLAGTTLTEDAEFEFGAARDQVTGLRPLVVSESAARRFWPGENAVGQTVDAGWYQAKVVGVVGDVRQFALAQDPPATVYLPDGPQLLGTVVVRAAGDPALLAGPIRAVIHEIDPDQPIRSIATLRDVAAESVANDRFFTFLYVTFGVLALTLAAVGVYGVVAYSVRLRTQEIGVRIAVGARAADIVGSIVRTGVGPVIVGAVLGSAASLGLARLIEHQLHGIGASDPITHAAAFGVLLLVATLASYVPARRAAAVDPIETLRAE